MPTRSVPPAHAPQAPVAAAVASSRAKTFHALAALLAHAAARGANVTLTRHATEAVARALDADLSGVWLYDAARVWCFGVDRFDLASNAHDVPDALSSQRVARHLAGRDGATFAAPIATRDGIVGLLVVERPGRARALSVDEECFVRAVADLLALCVEPDPRAVGRNARRSSAPTS